MKSLGHDNKLPHFLFAPVLFAAVILAVYYPAISNGFHTIDDPGIIAFFSSPPPLSDILLPGRNYYYRPIIELSYYIDSKLWGMEPSVMHLENILLHISNALLVFYIAKKFATNYPERSSYIPILASLLFAFHPLNVEAVSWVSGRTDPMAALFILSACFLLICWLENPKCQYAVGSVVLFVLGVLTKETALMFLPASLLFVLIWPSVSGRRRMYAAGGIVASSLMVFALIMLSWESGVKSLVSFFSDNRCDAGVWCQNSLVAFGFYVKKLLLPLPLNFAISEVDQSYLSLGVLVLVALAAALVVNRLTALFFIVAAMMISPALLVATKQIAWTPFAERYMYMPTAFLCLGTGSLFFLLGKRNLNRLVPFVVVVVCAAGYASFQRNLLWGDKLAFYQDAVVKSPGFGSVYNELGGQLLQHGQAVKASEVFVVADRINKRPSMKLLIKANIMVAMVANGKPQAARDYFFQLFSEKKAAPAKFIEILYTADGMRLAGLEKERKVLLTRDLLETLDLLYQSKRDPFWLYRSGQLALGIGQKKEAADFFRRAYADAPVDSHYKAAAKTNYTRLETSK